ncbi:MAG TPA: flagellar hook-basal body complex protein FliE [Verrucomicrobiae bacterium]|nr:flagellar hook-basal body complex protein FliE [Verrucomicrobiae bacterium]
MMPISNIQPLAPALPVSPAEQPGALAPAQPSGDSFSTMLGKMVSEVNDQQISAAQTVNNLQAGGNVSLHSAVIAMEEANVSFQLMVEVRNKLLDAYQEIMKMQV